MVSASPTNSRWVPSFSTSVIMRTTVCSFCFFRMFSMAERNSSCLWSSRSESMQVIWLTARSWPAMWNSL